MTQTCWPAFCASVSCCSSQATCAVAAAVSDLPAQVVYFGDRNRSLTTMRRVSCMGAAIGTL